MKKPCQFIIPWVGYCHRDTDKEYCEQHEKLRCCKCGAQATTECDATILGLMCGMPLCGSCKHHYPAY